MKTKKSRTKKKPKSETKKDKDKDVLSEVDKTFYELQIADLNRKLERLGALSGDLEQRNSSLSASNRRLDEDRADVIAYLKRTVHEQSAEIGDLLGRLDAIRATRTAEAASYEEQLRAKDTEYARMETALRSEIDLLDGKLNALEEFRLQRDELQKKFDTQEANAARIAKEHAEAVYGVEKKFVRDKHALVAQMQQRLQALSDDFQRVTDKRITETTQRLIRENIAVNNEIVRLVQEQKAAHASQEALRTKCRTQRLQMELAKDETQRCLRASHVQTGIIAELTDKYERLEGELQACSVLKKQLDQQLKTIEGLREDKVVLEAQIEVLVGNVKDCRVARKELLQQLSGANEKVSFFTRALFEAIFNIRHMVRVKKGTSMESVDRELRIEKEVWADRDAILNELYIMFLNVREAERECKDLETWVQFYKTGCAGFVPTAVATLTSADAREKHAATQLGDSFEEFLELQTADSDDNSLALTLTVASDFSIDD